MLLILYNKIKEIRIPDFFKGTFLRCDSQSFVDSILFLSESP